jgi:hypothetical protein
MNARNYRLLENRLSAAEEIFLNQEVFGRAREIRQELRDLLAKVVNERIRAEEAERQPEGAAASNPSLP